MTIQASFTLRAHTPDVLTCIANLSNDEVFTRRLLFQTALKFVYGIIFLPLLLLPIFRCYFKVPYIFCSVCPAQCPWGISRLLVFNTAILFNLSGKFWCVNICPFGTFQECQAQISPKRFKLSPWIGFFAYAGHSDLGLRSRCDNQKR